ncbi:uncharacterized protein LOC107266470 [Cephus cinctus]|uniref:Uncharacterized protein LOC107266470 n=1 Tax=Cephus cinctus TaxID=211228 RepID=A0AAJ7BS64_CEPCN|nr:uncharacterized protein LOC107266470 [Cephus cinctus]
MDMEVILADLSAKVPCLQCILRPEYTPYINTIGTILLGWIVISCISRILHFLFTPLLIGSVAVFLISPSSAKWCAKQLGPNMETVLHDFSEKIKAMIADIR